MDSGERRAEAINRAESAELREFDDRYCLILFHQFNCVVASLVVDIIPERSVLGTEIHAHICAVGSHHLC